jgi:DNA polymerase
VANGKLVHNSESINLQNLPRKSPLRKAIKAPEGYVIIDCDSSQIEARTLAWLAEQNDLVEAFGRGDDVYKIMASAIYDVPVEEVTAEQRFVGKTTILGCLAEGTLVLTDRGWVAIEHVTLDDRLWDGEEWVCHQGLVKKGIKETLNLCGLWLTPDHKILCGTQWLEAQSVVQDSATLSLALDTGAVTWLSPDMLKGHVEVWPRLSCSAIADALSTPLTATTLRTSKAHVAPSAAGGKATASGIGITSLHSPTSSTGCDSLTGFPPQSIGVTSPVAGRTPTTGVEVLLYTNSGEKTGRLSSGTSRRCPDGMTQTSKWTARTTTEDTNPATSGLSHAPSTMQIREKLKSFRRNLMTYDIAYAGPRNRYTVATNAGPIIVHNCGYGMGAERFQTQLKAFGVNLSLEECRHIIRTYRQTYPQIVKLWSNADRALDALRSQRTCELGREGVLQLDLFGIKLPNGMYLRYNNLRVDNDGELVYDTKQGKSVVPTKIYGGKSVENITQALARIIIAEQMLMISRRLRVVLTVHDSVVALAPEEQAGEARAFVEQCMRTRPKWAPGLPLGCESKVGVCYGG